MTIAATNRLTLVEPAPGSRSSSSQLASGSRDEILIAAAECFKENGFSATSIDDVARHLGATKGRIYHHHRSKMDLFFAVYRRGMEMNFQVTEPEVLSDLLPPVKLARMAMAHTVALMAHQPFQRVLSQGVVMHQTGSTTAAQRETLSELIDIRNSYETMFKKAIEAACTANDNRLTNASVASKSFLAVLNSTVYWYTPRKKDPLAEQVSLARDLVTYAIQGLGMQVPSNTLDDWEIEE